MEKTTDSFRGRLLSPILLTVLLLSFVSEEVVAVWITLPPTGTKCISEEIQSNVVVLGNYLTMSEDHSLLPTVSVKVTSPYGNSLHHNENVRDGQFAYTTHEAGTYQACFWIDGNNPNNKDVIVNLEWRTGISAKDWDSVARKEKIEGVELELRKLEGAVDAIHENLLYIKTREAEMRTMSETTNARVAWLSVLSLGICIGVSVLQIFYLKQYFQKKKLI